MRGVHSIEWHFEFWNAWRVKNPLPVVWGMNSELLIWMNVFEPVARPLLKIACSQGLIPGGDHHLLTETITDWARSSFVARATVFALYYEVSGAVVEDSSPAARRVLARFARVAGASDAAKGRPGSMILGAILNSSSNTTRRSHRSSASTH